ncbi:MAG: 4Fe-4S binding protein [Ignavibacteriales bacterium]|nr:4Fe-4S binding protein [Ignavibacteriales bacterium]
MSMIITNDCINCGACAVECPTEAIYESGESLKNNGKSLAPISNEHYFIVTEICDECAGINKIKCIAVCPMDAIKKI